MDAAGPLAGRLCMQLKGVDSWGDVKRRHHYSELLTRGEDADPVPVRGEREQPGENTIVRDGRKEETRVVMTGP